MKIAITFIAMLGYGLWAYFANCFSESIANPEMIATRAGIIQGAYAGALTFINVYLLEWLYEKLGSKLREFQAVAAAVGLATAAQYSAIIPVHLINQTPNIILTLLPGFVIGTGFSVAYTLTFAKSKKSGAPFISK